MGTPESLSRFLTRFVNNLFITLAGFLAVGLALSLLRMMPPNLLGFSLPLAVLGALTWTLSSPSRPGSRRLLSLLEAGRYENAFQLAARSNQFDVLDEHFRSSLALPSEALRPKVAGVFSELRILHQSLEDRSNQFVDSELRQAMRDRSGEARLSLWKLCQNLEVVARQKVRFADDHPKMRRIGDLLEELALSTGQVRVKLAELTLAPQSNELEEARIAIDQVRRQSEALLEWESLLESG